MMFADPRTEWRINDVEQKAERANARLYELDSLRRDVDSLEHSNRELCSKIDRLCSELETATNKIVALEETTHNIGGV